MPSSDPWRDDPWPHHGPTCICYACRRRRRRLEREALIEPRRLVDSTEVAEHIETLLDAGWKRIAIARATGLSPALVTKACPARQRPEREHGREDPGARGDEPTTSAVRKLEAVDWSPPGGRPRDVSGSRACGN